MCWNGLLKPWVPDLDSISKSVGGMEQAIKESSVTHHKLLPLKGRPPCFQNIPKNHRSEWTPRMRVGYLQNWERHQVVLHEGLGSEVTSCYRRCCCFWNFAKRNVGEQDAQKPRLGGPYVVGFTCVCVWSSLGNLKSSFEKMYHNNTSRG